MNREQYQRLLVTAALVLVIILSAGAVFAYGLPSKAKAIRILGATDPLLAYLLPGVSEAREQATADYVLSDDKTLYALAEADQVTVLMLEVYEKKEADLTTLEDPEKAKDLQLPVIMREGNADGSAKWAGFGNGAAAPNATVEIKGTPKENRKYHNLKVRLKNSAGRYEGQTIINLKKSYGKPCKVEEKFAFDLFASLPEMMSLRTEFVHLYIKNTAAPSPHYESYGLYTLVEQPDENYFLNRSLDDSGSLYQAEDFTFGWDQRLMDVTDPGYQKKEFEKVLDIKQGDSHKELLEMLAAVNDESRDIDEVVGEFFNRENLFTWLAMNVILGNEQCSADGYLLYKPSGSEVWFFIPANMSETMLAAGHPERYTLMETAGADFTGNLLYERLLAKPENKKELQTKVAGLMEFFESGTVKQLTDRYIMVLQEYLPVNPDKGVLVESPEAIIGFVEDYLETMRLNVREYTNKN